MAILKPSPTSAKETHQHLHENRYPGNTFNIETRVWQLTEPVDYIVFNCEKEKINNPYWDKINFLLKIPSRGIKSYFGWVQNITIQLKKKKLKIVDRKA